MLTVNSNASVTVVLIMKSLLKNSGILNFGKTDWYKIETWIASHQQ